VIEETMSERTERGRSPLAGRRVVVVGGTSGMGKGAVRAALAAGAEVIAAGRRPPAQRAADPALSGAVHETVDFTDEASVRALFARVGAFDHLLVTAAPGPTGASSAFLQQDVAAARRFMDEKFFGSWACARYAAPELRPGGSITFLTGGAAVRSRPGLSTIAPTFTALEALGRVLAVELAPLRVNTIRPGYTDSEMWSGLDPAAREALWEKVRAAMPVRRVGTVDDIGHAALFLMTNPQVTGTVLEVTGGETLVDGL
jgi:NAD(P)-dependent dehydrogenase (short-subunit alcohol dehydrogenase family)